jgi:two-component system, LytTR family, response regulator
VTLRALVVDDEPLPLQRIVELVGQQSELALVATATDGRGALDAIVEHQPDVVFLDIQMPELDGFQVISALDDEQLPAFVFVTAYDEYAIRAFEVDAIDYLLKPVSRERFAASVTRVLNRRRGEESSLAAMRALAARAAEQRRTPVTRFVARRGGKHYFVPLADVEWIEADGNYVRLHTGDRSHLIRETMKALEAKLDPDAFVRIHRSAVVSIARVASIEAREHGDYLLRMRNGAKLLSSRGYSERVRALLR